MIQVFMLVIIKVQVVLEKCLFFEKASTQQTNIFLGHMVHDVNTSIHQSVEYIELFTWIIIDARLIKSCWLNYQEMSKYNANIQLTINRKNHSLTIAVIIEIHFNLFPQKGWNNDPCVIKRKENIKYENDHYNSSDIMFEHGFWCI